VRDVSGRVVPILVAMLMVLVLVTYWPDAVLWLPRLAAQ
jgi:TRAP-type C4-dicarboxylate transport system permease large subunit